MSLERLELELGGGDDLVKNFLCAGIGSHGGSGSSRSGLHSEPFGFINIGATHGGKFLASVLLDFNADGFYLSIDFSLLDSNGLSCLESFRLRKFLRNSDFGLDFSLDLHRLVSSRD